MHLDLAAGAPRLRMPGGQCRGVAHDVRRRLDPAGTTDDHVASAVLLDVEPVVQRLGNLRGQLVVVARTLADEDLPAVAFDRAVALARARHVIPRRAGARPA